MGQIPSHEQASKYNRKVFSIIR